MLFRSTHTHSSSLFHTHTQGEAGEGDVPTQEMIEDLSNQCRTYCDSPDPYVTLSIGESLERKAKCVGLLLSLFFFITVLMIRINCDHYYGYYHDHYN